MNRGGEPAKIALGLLKLTVPFEGLCKHRFPQAFVEVLAQWRLQCTAEMMPIRPQTFLDLGGMDRPLSTYPTVARNLLLKALA